MVCMLLHVFSAKSPDEIMGIINTGGYPKGDAVHSLRSVLPLAAFAIAKRRCSGIIRTAYFFVIWFVLVSITNP